MPAKAVGPAVDALAHHLPRHQRSMTNYAHLLAKPEPEPGRPAGARARRARSATGARPVRARPVPPGAPAPTSVK
ncbi:tetratricopeptide repeat protein [Streptomyces lasiicapitis]|uniref:tetratricopeptide repeat protein n=1 Tax=Streptomyces lasiicapitis TaxID=1923961 RepID=UPI0036A1273B